jgi:D-alanine-D-alanine ligase
MDKLATKRVFIRHAIPTPDYLALGPSDGAEAAEAVAGRLGYPLVCKPARSGSSLGVTIVRSPDGLGSALADARAHGHMVLLERYVRGREFTVGVLAGEALPMVELVVRGEFFDYEAKYVDEATRYVTPVALLPTLYRKAHEASLRACRAMGCEQMARVDLIYGYDGGLYLLEVNTIPGLTPRSLLPMAAAEAGISFPALCDRLVREALKGARPASPRRRKTA